MLNLRDLLSLAIVLVIAVASRAQDLSGAAGNIIICKNPNEEWTNCGTLCPLNCENKDTNFPCAQMCVPGCFCKLGFVRDYSGKCIKPSDCPNLCPKPNEVFKACGTRCQPTCDNRNPLCTLDCAAGCFCKPGFIRKVNKGECVPEESCSCGNDPNAYSAPCGDPCPDTCSNLGQGPRPCPAICIPGGCKCRPGYVLNGVGLCILVKDCPKCGANEFFDWFGRACYPTCENKYPFCSFLPTPGCFCKPGYIRDKIGGVCIRPRDCGCKGDPNAESLPCGDSCPTTCANRFTPNRPCPAICLIDGCACKRGFILSAVGGKCIREQECPERCTNPFEVYKECGTACPPTCADRNPTCTFNCVPGCFCRRGYILSEKGGRCIRIYQCPEE